MSLLKAKGQDFLNAFTQSLRAHRQIRVRKTTLAARTGFLRGARMVKEARVIASSRPV